MIRSPLTPAFAAAFLAATALSASAQSPAALPVLSFAGFYAGVHAGYGFGDGRFGITPGGRWIGDIDLPGVTGAATRSVNFNSFLGGVQAGYNYRSGNIVFGFEADASAMAARGRFQSATFSGIDGSLDPGTYSAGGSLRSDWLVTLRPRVGVVVAERALFYVTGGLAIGDNRFSHHINFLHLGCDGGDCNVALPFTTTAGGANAASKSKTVASWTLGGGVEYAVSSKLSLRAEYLYVDLGKSSAASTFIDPASNAWNITHHERKNLNIVRIGLNYFFN